MIADLKTYGEYGDLGKDWLGAVSAHCDIEHHPAGHFDLLYDTTSEGNAKAAVLRALDRFSGIRSHRGRWSQARAEMDRLSNILKTFNDSFGTVFADTDRVAKRIRDDILPKVAIDTAFRNARNNTPHTARMAHDPALGKVMQILLKDDTQIYKQFVENQSFRLFVGDMVYQLTSQPNADRHA